MGKRQFSKRTRRHRKDLTFAKAQGGWHRRVIDRAECPTPAKRRFSTEEAALANSADDKRAYRCPCGDWHITTRRARKKEAK